MTWTIGDDLYRGQPNPAATGALANLRPVIADVCLDACPDDALTVWVQVENNSEEAVASPFTVKLRGETDAGEVVLATRDWTGGVGAGERSESVQWRVQPAPRPLYSLSVVVDAVGRVDERHEDDIVATWGGPTCP
jgi:hypothetical protein